MNITDPEQLRLSMRHWATGVSIVTSAFNGKRHGMTVNSFTSISLTPPVVLVSLERTSRTHKLVEQSGFFGVTILCADQQEVSDCFAGRHTEKEDRFDGLNTHTLVTGASFIDGGLAFLDCRVTRSIEAGTHTLFLGEVVAVEMGLENEQPGDPLLYYDRMYGRLQK